MAFPQRKLRRSSKRGSFPQAEAAALASSAKRALESATERDLELVKDHLGANPALCRMVAEMIRQGTFARILSGDTVAQPAEKSLPASWTRRKWKSFNVKWGELVLKSLIGHARYSTFIEALGGTFCTSYAGWSDKSWANIQNIQTDLAIVALAT